MSQAPFGWPRACCASLAPPPSPPPPPPTPCPPSAPALAAPHAAAHHGARETRRATRYAMLVVAVGVARLDGLALCRASPNLPDGADSVIRVETARTGPADLAEVPAAGADDYLAKP